MVLARQLTEAEYLALPEEPPYREYVYGEARAKAMPNIDHGELIQRVAEAIGPYRREHGGRLGPEVRSRFDTERGPEYRLPDYSYWAPGKPRGDQRMMLPPTLAVEVRSPDESMGEQREKCRYFRRHGVDVAWLIDPVSRTAEVFEDDADGEPVPAGGALVSRHLPGFSLAVDELFSVLDEQ